MSDEHGRHTVAPPKFTLGNVKINPGSFRADEWKAFIWTKKRNKGCRECGSAAWPQYAATEPTSRVFDQVVPRALGIVDGPLAEAADRVQICDVIGHSSWHVALGVGLDEDVASEYNGLFDRVQDIITKWTSLSVQLVLPRNRGEARTGRIIRKDYIVIRALVPLLAKEIYPDDAELMELAKRGDFRSGRLLFLDVVATVVCMLMKKNGRRHASDPPCSPPIDVGYFDNGHEALARRVPVNQIVHLPYFDFSAAEWITFPCFKGTRRALSRHTAVTYRNKPVVHGLVMRDMQLDFPSPVNEAYQIVVRSLFDQPVGTFKRPTKRKRVDM
jgi:hypothetical protein